MIGMAWSTTRIASIGLLSLVCASPLSAQTCGSDYTIKQGDSLAAIATRVYGTAAQWTIIFYANQDRLGANASLLVPGLAIRIPCVGGNNAPANLPAAATTTAAGPAPPPTEPSGGPQFLKSSLVPKVELLTADGLSPFTDRSLQDGGMIPALLDAALKLVKEESGGSFSYGISWVNDWSAHLNPLLVTRAFDAGFPWTKPNCDDLQNLDDDGKYRCQRFFYSSPLFEALTHLYVRKDSPVKSLAEGDIAGKSLCRPSGYETQELDEGGRNWVKGNKVTLIRPQTVDECFKLLQSGSVDIVAVPDLVGHAATTATGSNVHILEEPLAIRTFHVVVSKSHPQSRTVLYYVNSSIAKLRESGEYDRIVEQHLKTFWEPGLGTPAPPAPTSMVAPAAASEASPTKSVDDKGSPKQGEEAKKKNDEKK